MRHKHTHQVRIGFERCRAGGLIWNVSAEQGGQRQIYGPLRCAGDPLGARLQQLKEHYEQQLRRQRMCAPLGAQLPPVSERRLLELGRAIAGLLPEPLLHELRALLQAALRRRQHLRVTLEFDPSAVELLCIPWELLALPPDPDQPIQSEAASFIFLLAQTSLVRQIRQVGCAAPARLRRPLAVRAFCASPRQVAPIQIASTLASEGGLQELTDLQLNWYSGPDTLGALQERLCDGDTQIVHLLCHGEACDNGRTVRQHLVLSDAQDNPRRTTAAELARVLSLVPDLRLVVLQACHAGSATLAPADERGRAAVSGIVLELLQAGVPAVIAMQGEVGQSAAEQFVRGCYRVLSQGGPVERAVAAGRLAMYVAGGIVDWGLPVLYQGYHQPA